MVSSYSGNTKEINELASSATGGLKSTIFITSGGELEKMVIEWGLPLWKLPSGYKPRAALGWSLGYLSSILDRWRITSNLTEKMTHAALKFRQTFVKSKPEEHILISAALSIAKNLMGRDALLFHSLNCTGAARRLAAQINENGKQPAFAVLMPEGLHNAIEGISGGDPQKWTIIYMTDPNDTELLRDIFRNSIDYLEKRGFRCLIFPAAGSNQLEMTMSRVILGDFVSLFLAAERGIDPTVIPAISALKVEYKQNSNYSPKDEE